MLGAVKSLTTGLKEVQVDNQQMRALLTHQSPTTEIPVPSTSAGAATASGVTLPGLRPMQDLSQQADRRVAQLGLADSSDSDSDHDKVEPSVHVRAKDKSASNGGGKSLKSGKKSKIMTTVFYPQLWPHSFLSLTNARRGIKYDDLTLEEFVAGYGQILQSPDIAETERSARLKHSVSLMYFAQQYEWQAVLSSHGAVLLEIERGLLKWGDSLFHLESRTLYGNLKTQKSATSGGSSTSSNTVLYCRDFQRQHCSLNQALYGYLRSERKCLRHICSDLLGAIKKTRAPSRWLVRINLCLCKFGDKKLTTSNTFVHRAESVDERVPCFFPRKLNTTFYLLVLTIFRTPWLPLIVPSLLAVRVLVHGRVFHNTFRIVRLVILIGMFLFNKEMALGRVAGPFDTVPFADGSVVLPLNIVRKRDSDERRVIVDLSWPCDTSVNDGIPSDSFLGKPISLTYPTIDSIGDAVIYLGPGCLLYKSDLKKAYRHFPVDPKDYHLLGYTWDNQFYFDTVLTMGLRSAALACQRYTSAVPWISRQQGRSFFNYLDDFIGVSSPSTATKVIFKR